MGGTRFAAAAAGPQGWTARRAELNAAAPVSLSFVHRDSMRLLGTILFLLVATAGCWQATARPAWFVVALGVFAAAALLLPVRLYADRVREAFWEPCSAWSGGGRRRHEDIGGRS